MCLVELAGLFDWRKKCLRCMKLKDICRCGGSVVLWIFESDDGHGRSRRPDFYRHRGEQRRQQSACDSLMRNSDSVRVQIMLEACRWFAMRGDVSSFVRKTREASRVCWKLLPSSAPQVASVLMQPSTAGSIPTIVAHSSLTPRSHCHQASNLNYHSACGITCVYTSLVPEKKVLYTSCVSQCPRFAPGCATICP
jgi:hypothetical protein